MSLAPCLLGFGVPSGRPRTDSALYMWKSARPEVSQWDVVAEVQRLCQAEQRIRRLRTMLHGMPLCQYVIRSLVQCKVTARHQIVCLRVLAEVPAAKSWILLLAQGLALQVRHLIGDFRCGALPWAKSRNEVAYSCLPREPLLLPRA